MLGAAFDRALQHAIVGLVGDDMQRHLGTDDLREPRELLERRAHVIVVVAEHVVQLVRKLGQQRR